MNFKKAAGTSATLIAIVVLSIVGVLAWQGYRVFILGKLAIPLTITENTPEVKAAVPEMMPVAPNDYRLIRTGHKNNGSWSATLQKNGQNFQVAVGDQLPDRVRIDSIDANSVLMHQNNMTKLVTFSSVTQSVRPETKPKIIASSARANQVQPMVTAAINDPLREVTLDKNAALPLQQPMVIFPHHAIKHTADNPAVFAKQPVVENKTTELNSTQTNRNLLRINPDYYTVQLTSDRQLSNLQQFMQSNKLHHKTTYFRIYDMEKRPVYILIYGQFASLAQAKTAMAVLPIRMKDEGAFIVKFATIQTVINKPAPT